MDDPQQQQQQCRDMHHRRGIHMWCWGVDKRVNNTQMFGNSFVCDQCLDKHEFVNNINNNSQHDKNPTLYYPNNNNEHQIINNNK